MKKARRLLPVRLLRILRGIYLVGLAGFSVAAQLCAATA